MNKKILKVFLNLTLAFGIIFSSNLVFADGKSETTKIETKNSNSNNEKILKNRQFLTFETETGKEFVVVVDYYNTGKEARFLTELNENDMKNLINFQNLNSDVKNNFFSKSDKQTEEKVDTKNTEVVVENQQDTQTKKEQQKTSKKNKPNILAWIVGLGILLIGIGYIYFKKSKIES